MVELHKNRSLAQLAANRNGDFLTITDTAFRAYIGTEAVQNDAAAVGNVAQFTKFLREFMKQLAEQGKEYLQ